jgi:hypothetical protein
MYDDRNVCCLDCRKKGLDPRSGAYKRTGTNGIICAECGMEKASTNFRRSKNSLVQVCRDCEKIECDGCRRDILASKFDTKDRHFYFGRGHRVICCDCKTRLQRLRGRFQKSARKNALAADPWATRRTAPCIHVEQGKHRTRRVTYSQETRASGFMLEANYKAQVYGVLRWQWNGCTVAVPSFLNPGSRRNAALDNQYSRTEFHNCMQIS